MGGSTASATHPATIATSPIVTTGWACSRSTMRPAGTPLSAEMTGPIDSTRPVMAVLSPSALDR